MTISNHRQLFKQVATHPEHFYIIHYSCQSLYDDNDGLSPRITSIAVQHIGSGQTVSFSTHAIAEELGCMRSDVSARFDQIEQRLLEKFFEFVRDRKDKYWLHWNMRNITFGFEHLEHRFRTLKQIEPPSIPVERRININDMLAERFGDDYARHPRMERLMELNGGRHRHFLTGKEEVAAFNAAEFIKLHQSTLCKVVFFRILLDLVRQKKISTDARGFLNWSDRLLESRGARMVMLVAGFSGALATAWRAMAWLTG